MTIKTPRVISFDYGNTLIEFGPDQVNYMHGVLESVLTGMFGHCDSKRLKEIRDRQISAPYSNGYIENTLTETSSELISELYNTTGDQTQIDTLNQVRYDSFVQSISETNGLKEFLCKLKSTCSLVLISNYPCGRSITSSLEKTGLSDSFDRVIVSGDIGYVKPHTLPFEMVLDHFGIRADECLHIGDNWFADIQGAKRIGMNAVLTKQYEPYDYFEPDEGDLLPDYTINNLYDLTDILNTITENS